MMEVCPANSMANVPNTGRSQEHQQQWLVSFQNKTHVISLDVSQNNDKEEVARAIQDALSFQTGWPVAHLILDTDTINTAKPYVTVLVQSSLRGGKGGFGTLLRSSARQSGAKLTTDFGACRDLQGRRLRHVNDEIKLRKWREAQEAKEKGVAASSSDATTDAMFDTPSGLYNWHLMVPSWADISKKESSKIQRQFRRMQQEEDDVEKAKQEKRAQYDRSVTMYVQKGADTSKEVKNNVMSAVKEGLQAQKDKKRRREEVQQETSPLAVFQKEDRPNSLCTLSGDVVVEETQRGPKTVLQIQSQSDFSTLALFLDKPPVTAGSAAAKKKAAVLYYEIRLVTGGLAQIGWADMTNQDFHPSSEEGEGVGDDKGSFGYDGSRGLKFDNGTEEVYQDSSWKAGDVVGCQYNLRNGEISYSLNGTDLGVGFTVPTPGTMLFPGISCNGGEILEVHIRQEEMEHLPKSNKKLQFIPVQELIAVSITDKSNVGDASSKAEEKDGDKKPEAKESRDNKTTKKSKETEAAVEQKEPELKKEPVKVEALDLSQYGSVEALEKLGLDRLKGGLMAIGVKCGGSLKERAARLFSLKGVERTDYPTKVRAKNFIL